ncbi:MAG: type II toxin-antitoxin system HicB family antitoxin [Oscillospiraceae bacterium]|nr:type II toxin-antitoxin system HicB family antitoxin [Oscillospiraceae bacterium]
MKYAYPAVFTKEDVGYSVIFPDIPNCFTSGTDLPEAIEMAQDVLNLMLMTMEDKGIPISPASELTSCPHEDGEFVSLVSADTVEYRKKYGDYAVKKTLSIPAWLNTLAERDGINFSATLQKALKEALDLS